MDIIPKEERERLIALGYKGMMQEISEGKHCLPTSPYRDAIDALLASVKASEDANSSAKRDDREIETLAIAREAKRWAMYAAIAAVISIIISIINNKP